jgi:hypothetical protein
LTRAEDEGFLDPKCIKDLDIHDCGVPIGEILALGSGLTMTKEFDG